MKGLFLWRYKRKRVESKECLSPRDAWSSLIEKCGYLVDYSNDIGSSVLTGQHRDIVLMLT